jgi:hypothetical protein
MIPNFSKDWESKSSICQTILAKSQSNAYSIQFFCIEEWLVMSLILFNALTKFKLKYVNVLSYVNLL